MVDTIPFRLKYIYRKVYELAGKRNHLNYFKLLSDR